MKKTVKFFIISFIIPVFISGCSIKDNKSDDDIIKEKNSQNQLNEEVSIDVDGEDYNLLIRSEEISNAVVSLFGIDNTTSIIFNDKVVVALEMAEGHKLTDDVRKTIINTIKEKDNNISKILITDDKRIFNEIEEVISALLHGKSYDSQVDNINKIIKAVQN